MAFFKRKERDKRTLMAYQRVFESEDGMVILHDLMKSANVLTTSFNGDPYEAAYNEGGRAIVLRLLKTINTDPDKFIRKIEQGNQWEKNYVEE